MHKSLILKVPSSVLTILDAKQGTNLYYWNDRTTSMSSRLREQCRWSLWCVVMLAINCEKHVEMILYYISANTPHNTCFGPQLVKLQFTVRWGCCFSTFFLYQRMLITVTVKRRSQITWHSAGKPITLPVKHVAIKYLNGFRGSAGSRFNMRLLAYQDKAEVIREFMWGGGFLYTTLVSAISFSCDLLFIVHTEYAYKIQVTWHLLV